jgi:hypothetical protein
MTDNMNNIPRSSVIKLYFGKGLQVYYGKTLYLPNHHPCPISDMVLDNLNFGKIFCMQDY